MISFTKYAYVSGDGPKDISSDQINVSIFSMDYPSTCHEK